MDEKQVEAAMEIILVAGNARMKCKEALDAMGLFDFECAKLKMKEAQIKIAEAHKIQTDAIQGEIRGEKSAYSLLFAHAQDTLMTIYSEINITKQMIHIFNAYESRIFALEQS